ncbi:MAG TPA: glycosyltransferase family 4 protein [Anaerolineales bacterium]
MRVLWMLSGIAMGGGERNIVSVLPHLRDSGITVYLCTLNRRRDSPLAQVFAESGIERFDLGAKRMVDPGAWRRFSELLTRLKVDLVHAEDQDTIVYTALAHRLHAVRTVMTRHVMEEPVTSWKTGLRAQLVLWSARFGMNRIIAVAEVVRRQFAQQTHVPLAKIETIYNGIELEKFNTRGRRDAIRAKLGWDSHRRIAAFVSVMRPGKGFEVLFQAIPKIKAVIPDFQVKLVGSGPLEAELREQAAPLGDAVEFLGQRMDVPDLLGASDLLIQASWSEALPTVLIEAGAAGLPVVATSVGGTREIVQDGKGGFLIPAGEAGALADRTVEILNSPALADEMGRTAHDFVVKTFSLQRQAEQTVALYQAVLAGKHENPV